MRCDAMSMVLVPKRSGMLIVLRRVRFCICSCRAHS